MASSSARRRFAHTSPPHPSRRASPSGHLLAAHTAAALALIALLRGTPKIDERWENHPAHFWIVFLVVVVCLGLGSRSVRVRAPPRRELLLIGLAFVVSAGFHRPPRPRDSDRLSSREERRVRARDPVGLILAAASPPPRRSEYRLELALDRQTLAPAARVVLLLIVAWAAVSLGNLPPAPQRPSRAASRRAARRGGPVGVVAYAYAAFRYFRVYHRRVAGSPSPSRSRSPCSPRRSSSPSSR